MTSSTANTRISRSWGLQTGYTIIWPALFDALQAGRHHPVRDHLLRAAHPAWEPFLQQDRNNAPLITRYQIGRIAAKEPEACVRAIRRLLYDDKALRRMGRNMRLLKGRLEAQSLARIVATLAAQGRGVCA